MTDKSSKHTDGRDSAGSSSPDAEQDRKGSSTHDFYGAVAQLEESLQDLVGQKKEETLRQATAFIKDASARLNDQISGREDEEPLPLQEDGDVAVLDGGCLGCNPVVTICIEDQTAKSVVSVLVLRVTWVSKLGPLGWLR